ncbi:isocitrate lyase/phosphoenolpyruvate mutase family protein [Micromonospora sp. NPDC092111]|uniref:isocitrate lyase/phosphoenolpyruvate mutase family protein n=1 Tax=Micromonospora sp. NPDC092111 TaxID=3364289 RepID=UPI0037F820F9
MCCGDSRAADEALLPPSVQARRIEAAREAAARAGVPDFFVNARTDVYLGQSGAPGERLDDVRARADHYAKAGADGLFVPGLLDLTVLAALVASSPMPVNVLARPGGPSVADLAEVGVDGSVWARPGPRLPTG